MIDLDSTTAELNSVVWKHAKHIEQQKKRFQEKSAKLIQEITGLCQECEKTAYFISDMETRLEQVASTPTQAEILLFQMLKGAEVNLQSTQIALQEAKKRLDHLRTDYEAIVKLEQENVRKFTGFCQQNASDVAKWESKLGCSITPVNGNFEVKFGDISLTFGKFDGVYGFKQDGNFKEFDFDGNIPRMLLAMRALI